MFGGMSDRRVPVRSGRPNANRQRAVEAMLDQILETGAMPSIEAVLDRAGISRRTFFRFFPSEGDRILSVDSLMRHRLLNRFEQPLPDDRRTFEQTLEVFVRMKSGVDEFRMPMRKLAEAKKASHPKVEAQLKAGRTEWLAYIRALFAPHLSERTDKDALVECIHFNSSWSVWATLRNDFEMSPEQSRRFIERQILAVFRAA